jgi:hypothetical protein
MLKSLPVLQEFVVWLTERCRRKITERQALDTKLTHLLVRLSHHMQSSEKQRVKELFAKFRVAFNRFVNSHDYVLPHCESGDGVLVSALANVPFTDAEGADIREEKKNEEEFGLDFERNEKQQQDPRSSPASRVPTDLVVRFLPFSSFTLQENFASASATSASATSASQASEVESKERKVTNDRKEAYAKRVFCNLVGLIIEWHRTQHNTLTSQLRSVFQQEANKPGSWLDVKEGSLARILMQSSRPLSALQEGLVFKRSEEIHDYAMLCYGLSLCELDRDVTTAKSAFNTQRLETFILSQCAAITPFAPQPVPTNFDYLIPTPAKADTSAAATDASSASSSGSSSVSSSSSLSTKEMHESDYAKHNLSIRAPLPTDATRTLNTETWLKYHRVM